MWLKHRSGLAPETSPAAALVGANCISQHSSHISEEFISGINPGIAKKEGIYGPCQDLLADCESACSLGFKQDSIVISIHQWG